MKSNRRRFLQVSGLGALGLSVGRGKSMASPAFRSKKVERTFSLGVASYSLRAFDVDKTLDITRRLGIHRIALKSMHLPLDSSVDDIKKVLQKAKERDITIYGAGVVYMKNKEEADQAFEYAKNAGMEMIIGVPEHELLPYVEEKVKEYDIKLAIHNHGPGDEKYPSPESAYKLVQNMDPRMGLCIDIGHTERIGIDPSDSLMRLKERVHDIHIKDETAASPEGTTIEIGRGVIDIPKFLKTVIDVKYAGTVSLEFEKDKDDPLPGMSESVGYVRGVLDTLE